MPQTSAGVPFGPGAGRTRERRYTRDGVGAWGAAGDSEKNRLTCVMVGRAAAAPGRAPLPPDGQRLRRAAYSPPVDRRWSRDWPVLPPVYPGGTFPVFMITRLRDATKSLVISMLHKDAKHRPQDAGEALLQLEQLWELLPGRDVVLMPWFIEGLRIGDEPALVLVEAPFQRQLQPALDLGGGAGDRDLGAQATLVPAESLGRKNGADEKAVNEQLQ